MSFYNATGIDLDIYVDGETITIPRNENADVSFFPCEAMVEYLDEIRTVAFDSLFIDFSFTDLDSLNLANADDVIIVPRLVLLAINLMTCCEGLDIPNRIVCPGCEIVDDDGKSYGYDGFEEGILAGLKPWTTRYSWVVDRDSST